MSDYFRHELNPYNSGGDESARTNYFIFQAGMITINNELSPVIQTLQEQNKAQAEEIEKLKSDREKLVGALKYSGVQFRYLWGISKAEDVSHAADYAKRVVGNTLKSMGEIE